MLKIAAADNFTWIAKCSLRVVCTSTVPSADSQEPRIRCPYTRARFQGQLKEHVSLLFQGWRYYSFSGSWPCLVSMRLRKWNAYLCICLSIYWFLRKRSGSGILEKWKIVTSAFVNHRIRVNRLGIYLH